MKTPRPFVPVLILALMSVGPLSLHAQQGGPGRARELMQANAAGLSAADEERDAREIAKTLNEAVNLRRQVTVTLLNDAVIAVTGQVTTERYWLIITAPDRSEIRFRAAMIASVKIV